MKAKDKMTASERRNEILKVLSLNRQETIENLAFRFGVSKRTILRDIEFLSLSSPIYTKCGRYGGGVYVEESYFYLCSYMSTKEINVLNKLAASEKTKAERVLTDEEIDVLNSIILLYTKPKAKKGGKK